MIVLDWSNFHNYIDLRKCPCQGHRQYVTEYKYRLSWEAEDEASVVCRKQEIFAPDSMETGFPGGASDEEPACQWGRLRVKGLIPDSGRSPRGGRGNPL